MRELVIETPAPMVSDDDAALATTSDSELVGQVVLGSEAAFAALYDRHVKVVLHAALRLTRDRSTAEDVVQETFLALWNKAETFDARIGGLEGWLVTIARRRALDHLRATARRPSTPFSALETDGPEPRGWLDRLMTGGSSIASASPEIGPEQQLDRRETARLVAEAVGDLSAEERLAIGLAYGDGLSQAEIAARLGWPLGTVKTRSRRALARMRAALAASEPMPLGPSRLATTPPVMEQPAITTTPGIAPCAGCP